VRRLLAVLGLSAAMTAAVAVAGAPPASAHPLGNFTVNRYSGIVVSPDRVRVRYVVDMAEIPTFQEMPAFDANGDGTANSAERHAWADRTAKQILARLSVAVDGRTIPLSVAGASLAFRPGQGGLSILRLEVTLVGAPGPAGRMVFRDRNYPGRIGWREVTARSDPGVALTGASVPSASVSGELLAYPSDLLSSPLNVTAATLSFRPGRAAAAAAPVRTGPTASGAPAVSGSAFASLISRSGGGLPLLVMTLLVALSLGAVHAMGPGHGKTIVAAYLVGAGVKARTIVAVGVAVSLMHTASVLALGAVTLYASRYVPPDRVYPWLGVASGALVVALGSVLVVVRSRVRRAGRDPWHPHPRHQDHDPDHEHDHDQEREHDQDGPVSRRGLVALAVSGGILPSPTALVVLLASIALHRLAYGLLLIAFFSLGLAAALTVVGLLAVRARSMVTRRLGTTTAALLPLASAGFILVAGLVLTARSVVQVV
jgi:nickel/cobalt exporter